MSGCGREIDLSKQARKASKWAEYVVHVLSVNYHGPEWWLDSRSPGPMLGWVGVRIARGHWQLEQELALGWHVAIGNLDKD